MLSFTSRFVVLLAALCFVCSCADLVTDDPDSSLHIKDSVHDLDVVSPPPALRRNLDLEDAWAFVLKGWSAFNKVKIVWEASGASTAFKIASIIGKEGYFLWVDSLHQCSDAYIPTPFTGSMTWLVDPFTHMAGCGFEMGSARTVKCGNKNACCCPDGYWAPRGFIGKWKQAIQGKFKEIGCTKCYEKPKCSDFVSKQQCEKYSEHHECDCDEIFPAPFCSTGIERGNVCCASSCGSCGGSQCSQRPGGKSKCCTGAITDEGRTCSSGTDEGCLIPYKTPEQTCYRSLGKSYCRGPEGERASDNDNVLQLDEDMSEDECRTRCTQDSSCKGFHTQSDGRCFIYRMEVNHIKSSQRRGECFQKYECQDTYLNLKSERSGDRDGDSVEVSCPSDYTMTDCQCFSRHKDCEGSMIVGNKCRAVNGGSRGVYARARCIKGVESASVQVSEISGDNDDDKTATTCPEETQLLGCMCVSAGGSCDGATPEGRTCTAQNGRGANGIYARAVCGVIPHDGYLQMRSEPVYHNNDRATLICPEEYLLTGCSCRSAHKNCDGAFHLGQRVCKAQAGEYDRDVTAHAICVKPVA